MAGSAARYVVVAERLLRDGSLLLVAQRDYFGTAVTLINTLAMVDVLRQV